MSEYKNTGKDRIITRPFILMFLASFSSAMVLYMLVSPVAEICYSISNDLTLSGFASGIYIIGGTFSLIFAGKIFKKWGWKKTGIIFLAIHFLTCFLYFLPLNVSNILIIRLIHGFGIGLGYAAIVTITSHIIPKSRHSEGVGIFYLAEPIALGAYSLLNVVYPNHFISICFTLAVIFSGIGLLCMVLVKYDEPDLAFETEESKLKQKGIANYIDIPTLPIAIFTMLSCFGYVAFLTFSQIYSTKVNLTSQFDYFFLIYMVAVIISRPIIGKLQDMFGDSIVSTVPIILQASCLFLLIMYPCAVTVYLSAIFTACGYGALYSVGTSMATEYASEEREHLAVSTFILFNDLVMGFGASILGLFSFIGIEGVFLAAGVFGILGLPISLYVNKTRKRRIIA